MGLKDCYRRTFLGFGLKPTCKLAVVYYLCPMSKNNRLLVVFNTLLATILVLVLIQFAPSVANANSTTIVACANKKTGALRIAYRACSKKENNVTWGVTGPQGATGATGPQGASGPAGQDRSGYAVVKDDNGVLIPNVVDLNWANWGPIVLKEVCYGVFIKQLENLSLIHI